MLVRHLDNLTPINIPLRRFAFATRRCPPWKGEFPCRHMKGRSHCTRQNIELSFRPNGGSGDALRGIPCPVVYQPICCCNEPSACRRSVLPSRRYGMVGLWISSNRYHHPLNTNHEHASFRYDQPFVDLMLAAEDAFGCSHHLGDDPFHRHYARSTSPGSL